jgi:hypothetical protein
MMLVLLNDFNSNSVTNMDYDIHLILLIYTQPCAIHPLSFIQCDVNS